jgi:hypothetical protein
MKQITLCALFFLSLLYSKGQVMAPALVEKYPPGVVSKIYEVTLNTLISHETQIKLANVLVARDKWVMEAAQKDGSLQLIKNALDSFQVLFNAQFAKADRVVYETYLHKGFIEGAAKTVVAALQQQYVVDAETAKGLYTLHRARQLAAIKGYALLEAGQPLTDSVAKLLALTDSLYQGHITVAKGEGYFRATLQKMNAAKPVAGRTADCLHQKFVASTLRHGNDYHQNFNMAMRYCVMDTVHFKAMYTDSLEAVLRQRARAELTDYRYRYNLNQWDVDSIAPLIYDRIKQNLWLETRHPFGPARDSLQVELNELSEMHIKKRLVKMGYHTLGTSRISWALQFRKILQITPQQVDNLCAHEIRIDSMIYRLSINKSHGLIPMQRYIQANTALRQILTANQYDSLPFLESLSPARKQAQATYRLAVEYKLAAEADSLAIVAELFHYFSVSFTLGIRFDQDPVKYERLYKVAVLNRPDIIKRLVEIPELEAQRRVLRTVSGRPLEY